METQTKVKEDQMLQLVTFALGSEEYAIDILAVQEIIRPTRITKVPRTPGFVEGVINLRGQVIPVIDLRTKFGFDKIEQQTATRIIVVEVEERVMGIVVDRVSEVLRLPSNQVEPPPPIVGGIESKYIRGVGKIDQRLLILLDLDQALDAEEMEMIESAATSAD